MAQTTAFGTVEIDEKYNACLSFDQFEALLTDLLHEGMHASDSIWQRVLDAWKQPDMTENHQSIHLRVRWETNEPTLELFAPDGSSRRNYSGPKNEALYKQFLWGIGLVKQIGSPYNPNPITKYTKELYNSLYPSN